MINIDNTHFTFKIKQQNNIDYIYDDIRKKWYVITPEEWVRQNIVQHLTQVLQYPSSLIAIEKEIQVNQQKKRFDIVVYKNDAPYMIVECKQPNIEINHKTLQQILSYNSIIQAHYIVITNGNQTLCWQIENNNAKTCTILPSW